MAKKPKYYVKESTIHGRGVFARKKIKKGSFIGEYQGNRISWEEANERYVELDGHCHTFFFGIDEETVIDGDDNGNDVKYINHSCKPNAEAINDDGQIFIYALKKIKKDDEIFYDYKLEYPEKITKKVKRKYACFCGNSNCRGTQLDI